jgi:hypothetical protein
MVQYKWRTNSASFNAIQNTLKQQSMLINSKKCSGAIMSVVHYLPPLRYVHIGPFNGKGFEHTTGGSSMHIALSLCLVDVKQSLQKPRVPVMFGVQEPAACLDLLCCKAIELHCWGCKASSTATIAGLKQPTLPRYGRCALTWVTVTQAVAYVLPRYRNGALTCVAVTHAAEHALPRYRSGALTCVKVTEAVAGAPKPESLYTRRWIKHAFPMLGCVSHVGIKVEAVAGASKPESLLCLGYQNQLPA